MTLAEAQAAVAKVEAALANGSLQVMFSDRSVMYKSNADLLKALDYFSGQVALLSRNKQSVAYADKGLSR